MPVTKTSGQGRPKGARNKRNQRLQEVLGPKVDDYFKDGGQFWDDLAKVRAEEGAEAAAKLMVSILPYVAPKQAQVKNEHSGPMPTIVIASEYTEDGADGDG
jgi:hypothetical protein